MSIIIDKMKTKSRALKKKAEIQAIKIVRKNNVNQSACCQEI